MPRRLGLLLALIGVLVACCPLPSKDRAALPSAIDSRLELITRTAELTNSDFVHPKYRSYDILALTSRSGCGSGDRSSYMADLSSTTRGSTADEPIEIFSLPPLIRYLYQFGACLTEQQKQKLLDGFARPQRLTGHGTTNHAIMRASSWYLLAQYFPQAQWIDWDGTTYTSPQLMKLLGSLLAARTARFFQSGHTEWLSPTYAMVNLFPLLNLIDFAANPIIRKNAEDEAALEVSILRTHSFHGVLVPPLTRKNYDQYNAPRSPESGYVPSVSQQVLWYYFGAPRMTGYDVQGLREPNYVVMLALSAWRPPAALEILSQREPAGYAIQTITPSFSSWGERPRPHIYGDSFISNEYAIGTGNVIFEPDGYNDHTQTFSLLIRSPEPDNQIECYHPYFRSNLGEDAWSTDRWSPFQQTHRYDDSSAIILFDIPKSDPWTYEDDNRFFASRTEHRDSLLRVFQCRIPTSVDEFLPEPNWLFVRQGAVYVAIGTLKGVNEYGLSPTAPAELGRRFNILKIREPRSALFFKVALAGPGLTFKQFQLDAKQHAPSYDASNSTAYFTDASGSTTRVAFDLHPEAKSRRIVSVPRVFVNGQLSVRSDSVITSRPLQLSSGLLTIGDQRLRIAPSP